MQWLTCHACDQALGFAAYNEGAAAAAAQFSADNRVRVACISVVRCCCCHKGHVGCSRARLHVLKRGSCDVRRRCLPRTRRRSGPASAHAWTRSSWATLQASLHKNKSVYCQRLLARCLAWRGTAGTGLGPTPRSVAQARSAATHLVLGALVIASWVHRLACRPAPTVADLPRSGGHGNSEGTRGALDVAVVTRGSPPLPSTLCLVVASMPWSLPSRRREGEITQQPVSAAGRVGRGEEEPA